MPLVTIELADTVPNDTRTGPQSTLRAALTMSNALTDCANVLHPGSPRTTVAVRCSRSRSVTT